MDADHPENGVLIARLSTAYTALTELRGKLVGVTAGSGYINQLQAAGVEMRVYPGNRDALNGLVAGEVQAVVQGETSIRFLQEREGLFAELRWAETYSPNSPATYPAIAVRSGDFELLGRIQAALQKMKGDGTLATVTEGWGLAATPPNL